MVVKLNMIKDNPADKELQRLWCSVRKKHSPHIDGGYKDSCYMASLMGIEYDYALCDYADFYTEDVITKLRLLNGPYGKTIARAMYAKNRLPSEQNEG